MVEKSTIVEFTKELSSLSKKVSKYNKLKNSSDYVSAKETEDMILKEYRQSFKKARANLFSNCYSKLERPRRALKKAEFKKYFTLENYRAGYSSYKNTIAQINESIKENPELTFDCAKNKANFIIHKKEYLFEKAIIKHEVCENIYKNDKDIQKEVYVNKLNELKKSMTNEIENDETLNLVKQKIASTDKKLNSLVNSINNDIISFENKYRISNATMAKLLSRETKTPWKIIKTNAEHDEYGIALINANMFKRYITKVSIGSAYRNKINGNMLLAKPYGRLDSYLHDDINSSIAKRNKDSENHNWIEDYLLYKGIYVEKNKESEMKKASTKQSERVVNAIDSYLRALSNIKK